MDVTVKGRNVSVTGALERHAREKVERVARFFDDERNVAWAEVELIHERNPAIRAPEVADATLFINGTVLKAREASGDMYASIDLMSDKLERQVKRYRGRQLDRWHGRRERHAQEETPRPLVEEDGDEIEARIVRTKQFQMKPMSPEEAALQMELELEKLVEPLDTSGIEVVRIDDTGKSGDPYEDYLAEGSAEAQPSVLEDEEETIAINYTSGTTGKPKGVMYSHRGAYLNALGVALALNMNSDSVFLWILPMFHCCGWCYTWGVTAVAGTHVCLRKVEPGRIWELFESEGITHYCAAPTVQIPLANHDDAYRLDRKIGRASCRERV